MCKDRHCRSCRLQYIVHHVDAFYAAVFQRANRDLDDSLPAIMLAASTRLLFAPIERTEQAGLLPASITDRIHKLVNGGAAELWASHDWDAHLNAHVDTVRSSTIDMLPKIIASSTTSRNPAQMFKRLSAIPFAPPTPKVREVLKSKINSAPNPDEEWLRALAVRHLPKPPHGKAMTLSCADLERVSADWGRRLDRSKKTGAPDGTGLRFAYLQEMRCARPEFARWMAHIADHQRSPFLEWWFTTGTLVGQCKTDDQGRYPTDPAEIDTARPISRLFVIRRLKAVWPRCLGRSRAR